MHTPKNIQLRCNRARISPPILPPPGNLSVRWCINHEILVQPLRVHRCTCVCVHVCICVCRFYTNAYYAYCSAS